ncbi:MAG: hypothetical protein EA418_12980 [Wenzhouxiangellaceae bacterium]|nr:MAG: hypothetical protein EA418_12980 [Wenzhouxiangellaceae bacterium]
MKSIQKPTRSIVVLSLALTFALSAIAPQAIADAEHSGPKTPYCILLAKLIGKVPANCIADEQHTGLDESVLAQLDALRLATVAFHSFDVAAAAGWDTAISPCVESPMGGMGYHIANISQLTNGGHLQLLRPEVLLYAPTEDGSMEFLGVEYIIPAADWPHDHAPEFLGQHLHYNPVQDIWALHVWSARHNPTGIFEDWNPEVSCEFATD